jgi:hypothetical protein
MHCSFSSAVTDKQGTLAVLAKAGIQLVDEIGFPLPREWRIGAEAAGFVSIAIRNAPANFICRPPTRIYALIKPLCT